MSMLAINMAVPVKDNNRESQIYFLASDDNVQVDVERFDTKYLVFKTLELIVALCALVLFAYGMQENENELENLIKYVGLGGITIYPLLYILLINTKKRRLYMILINVFAMITLFTISGSTASFWRLSTGTGTNLGPLNQLRSSLLCVINGFLYLTETLILCFESRHYCARTN